MSKERTPSVEIEFGFDVPSDPGRRPLSTDKKIRHLIFDYNARAELQDLAGTYQSQTPTLKAVRAVVWAGLLAETLDKRGRETERTLSLIEVGDILETIKDDPEAMAELTKAITEAFGISEAPKEENPQTASTSPA